MSRSDFSSYAPCHLCPRECGVVRTSGERGVCGETDVCRVASIGIHLGEEPSFSGTHGSGTIFFTGCSCHCFFCQNYQIATGKEGSPISEEALLNSALSLVQQGVHNLNFVTPDHYWPHIKWLCQSLREWGIDIPFLFNCSGYQKTGMIVEYANVMDLFLPDFKFFDSALAAHCMNDPRYADIALKALREMVKAKGFLSPWDPSGQHVAKQGVLVRHLVLPGHAQDSCAILECLFREFGPELPLSIMSQFHPVPACYEKNSLTGRVSPEEYSRVCETVECLGFERVYIQEGQGDDQFMPDFSLENPFQKL